MITDLDYLKTMSGDDPEFIREMIGIFKEQIAEYATAMPDLVRNSEHLKLSKLAHKAKSSVSVMGMMNEADLLKKLEIMAREGNEPEQYEDMVNTFLEHSRIAIDELDKMYK